MRILRDREGYNPFLKEKEGNVAYYMFGNFGIAYFLILVKNMKNLQNSMKNLKN